MCMKSGASLALIYDDAEGIAKLIISGKCSAVEIALTLVLNAISEFEISGFRGICNRIIDIRFVMFYTRGNFYILCIKK